MLSAAASHLSSLSPSAHTPIINEPPCDGASAVLLPDFIPHDVANRSGPLAGRDADVTMRVSGDDSKNFIRHLSNVGKAEASARTSVISTVRSHTEIIGPLGNARARLDAAIRNFAPGFPDRFDIPLTGACLRCAIAPLMDAIKNYDRELRHIESLQTRRCRPLSSCIAGVAATMGLAGSALVLLGPDVRLTPQANDFNDPALRLSAALLCYIPLLTVGIHYLCSKEQPISDLREALSALRRELIDYEAANAALARSPTQGLPDDPVGAFAAAGATTHAMLVEEKHAVLLHTEPQSEDCVVVDIPRNGSHFLM